MERRGEEQRDLVAGQGTGKGGKEKSAAAQLKVPW